MVEDDKEDENGKGNKDQSDPDPLADLLASHEKYKAQTEEAKRKWIEDNRENAKHWFEEAKASGRVTHVYKCCLCGRELQDEVSQQRGIGPQCLANAEREAGHNLTPVEISQLCRERGKY